MQSETKQKDSNNYHIETVVSAIAGLSSIRLMCESALRGERLDDNPLLLIRAIAAQHVASLVDGVGEMMSETAAEPDWIGVPWSELPDGRSFRKLGQALQTKKEQQS